MTMKSLKKLACIALVGVATPLLAQEAVTTETVTTSVPGTITTVEPADRVLVVRGETEAAPTRYYYTEKTTVVDPTGQTVAFDALKEGIPATFYYTREGDRMVVSKVVLSKKVVRPEMIEEKSTTTTTT